MPLSSLFSAALFFSIQRVRSHGVLTKPVSRILAMATNETENGLQFGGTCPNKACVWYSQDVGIPGPPTNCDKKMRTMGVNCGDTNPSDFTCEQKIALVRARVRASAVAMRGLFWGLELRWPRHA